MSAAELVDVVDAQDRVVGRASRGEVRARRLRHRATYLLVFNGRGELFIHLRTAEKDIYPSYWDVAVGGVVGAGESYDDGARRELAEEVGIRDAVPEALFDFATRTNAICVNGRVYRVVWDGPLSCRRRKSCAANGCRPPPSRERMRREPFCRTASLRSSASSS
jgi:8-oxo-dGTP pyrophosphatase MutT (NUDIX family)